MLKALEDGNVPLRSLAMLRSSCEPWTCVTQLAHLGAQEARCLEEGQRGFSSTCDVNSGSFTLMENLQKPNLLHGLHPVLVCATSFPSG